MAKLVVSFRKFAKAPEVLHSAHTEYLCILYGSQNKERLVPTD